MYISMCIHVRICYVVVLFAVVAVSKLYEEKDKTCCKYFERNDKNFLYACSFKSFYFYTKQIILVWIRKMFFSFKASSFKYLQVLVWVDVVPFPENKPW